MQQPLAIERRAMGRPPKQPGAAIHRRVTERIQDKEADDWVAAMTFAMASPDGGGGLGMAPTVHTTVQWSQAPMAGAGEPERLQALMNKVAIQLRRWTGRPAVWLYAREGGLKKGVHLHLLAYVPPAKIPDFDAAMKRWVAAGADSFDARAVKTVPVWSADLDTLRSYFLKEGTDEVHDRHGVLDSHRDKRNRYPIPVAGQRLKASHAIGPTARAKHRLTATGGQHVSEH